MRISDWSSDVCSSDLIKIALGEVVQRGDMTLKQRDRLLERMTDEVARLVLRDNYQQAQATSVAEAQTLPPLDQQPRFIRTLERDGQLNPGIEIGRAPFWAIEVLYLLIPVVDVSLILQNYH